MLVAKFFGASYESGMVPATVSNATLVAVSAQMCVADMLRATAPQPQKGDARKHAIAWRPAGALLMDILVTYISLHAKPGAGAHKHLAAPKPANLALSWGGV